MHRGTASVDAFDYELMVQTLRDLKQGKRVQIPIYDFTTHKRYANKTNKTTIRTSCWQWH